MRTGKRPLLLPTPLRGALYGAGWTVLFFTLIIVAQAHPSTWERVSEGNLLPILGILGLPLHFGIMASPYGIAGGTFLGLLVWLIARSERRGDDTPRLPIILLSMLLWGGAGFALLLLPSPLPLIVRAAMLLLALFAGYRLGVCSWRRDILRERWPSTAAVESPAEEGTAEQS